MARTNCFDDRGFNEAMHAHKEIRSPFTLIAPQ